MRTLTGLLILLACSTVSAEQPFGFGKVVTLGRHDTLIQHESLRVLTADTVGFVFYQEGRQLSGAVDSPASFSILEDGKVMGGHQVLGRFVKLHHMGHVPKPYLPATLVGTIYVKLPKPMIDGKAYTFRSKGIGAKETNVTFKWSANTVLSDAIKVNQIGYLPDSNIRLAYVGKWMGTGGALQVEPKEFSVIDLATGKVAFSGTATVRHQAGQKSDGAYKQDFSGENVFSLDFAALKDPGVYCITIPNIGRSFSFRIGDDVMAEPLFTSIRALFHARCGIALEKENTPWVRDPCKQHAKIGIYPEYGKPLNFQLIKSFIEKGKADGTLRYKTVTGGYHDAADYDRRPSHIPIAQSLCWAYEMNPTAFIDKQFIIPESGNGLPDILDEAYFLLLYYLQTQWPDGGISGGSEGTGHPFTYDHPDNPWRTNTDNESVEYIMRPVTGASCFFFAGSAAHLGRVIKGFPNGREKGQNLINAAVRAFDCGMTRFPPKTLGDEIRAATAAAHLMHATRDERFAKALAGFARLRSDKIDFLNNIVFAFSYTSIPRDVPGVDVEFQEKLKRGCDGAFSWAINAFTRKKAYLHFKHPYAPIGMGTHSVSQAWWLTLMWKMTGKQVYYDLLCASVDVALGANPMGQVQCSGLGQKHALHPEYLESMNDNLTEYLPGLWVYGPGKGQSWITNIYPPTPKVESIPLLYSFYDVDQWPGQTEFTVAETIAPAVVMFGVLAPKNPQQYVGPLPSPK